MENEQDIIDYYANDEHKDFYKKLWGGESIHIGIYNSYKLNCSNEEISSETTEITPNVIKNAGQRKSELMYRVMKMYLNDYHSISSFNIRVADLGSGYGGTARYIYNRFNWGEKSKEVSINCYDLSMENCFVNMKKNIHDNFDISVYNRSFCDTGASKSNYNLIISEDAFIHLSDKTPIFEEINRILCGNGYLIFSDIVLTDTADLTNIDEVYKRINITKMENISSYKKLVENNGFTFCNFIPYKEDMITHYKNLATLVRKENYTNKNILDGINNWIKHTENNNITVGIFVFRKK